MAAEADHSRGSCVPPPRDHCRPPLSYYLLPRPPGLLPRRAYLCMSPTRVHPRPSPLRSSVACIPKTHCHGPSAADPRHPPQRQGEAAAPGRPTLITQRSAPAAINQSLHRGMLDYIEMQTVESQKPAAPHLRYLDPYGGFRAVSEVRRVGKPFAATQDEVGNAPYSRPSAVRARSPVGTHVNRKSWRVGPGAESCRRLSEDKEDRPRRTARMTWWWQS